MRIKQFDAFCSFCTKHFLTESLINIAKYLLLFFHNYLYKERHFLLFLLNGLLNEFIEISHKTNRKGTLLLKKAWGNAYNNVIKSKWRKMCEEVKKKNKKNNRTVNLELIFLAAAA